VTSEARLERLLYILPAAAGADGVALDELAERLGVTRKEILRDLEEATARAYYHPAGSTEDFEIRLEGERVSVWSPAEFQRPVRLSGQETLALGLGLRTLAAEAEEPRRSEILALAARLERDLASPALETHTVAPVRDEVSAFGIELGADEFRGAVAEAAQMRVRCRILYLKPGEDTPRERTLEPYALVYGRGAWYVLGHDSLRSAIRVFRMDRILEAHLTEERFEVPEGFDPAHHIGGGDRAFTFDEHETAKVKYSARVARWVAEGAHREATADGGVILDHRVADPRWIVRHVLQYGGDAELTEPAGLRDRVARAAQVVAERAA
jgi:predicted DNA-binding transcriptional regulator YafY